MPPATTRTAAMISSAVCSLSAYPRAPAANASRTKHGLSAAVSMRTRAPRWRRHISRVAEMPLSPRRKRSMIVMSGRCSSALRQASCAVAASATTSSDESLRANNSRSAVRNTA